VSATWAVGNRKVTFASVVALSGVALAVSLFRVGSQSLWLDEGFSVHFARSSLGTFPSLIRAESNMALYHLLLHFWLFLGHSEAVIRGLSVLFAVATIPVLFVLAEHLFDRAVAWGACALLIPNVFYVHYAQEARSYALVLFLSVAASALFVRALERPSNGHWTAYVIAIGLGTWAHFFIILVAMAHLVSLTFLERRLRPSAKTLLAVCAGIVIAVAPLAVFVSSQNGHKADWLTRPSPRDAVRAIEALAGGRSFLLLAYALACVAFTVSAARLLRRTRTWTAWRFAFVLSWLVVPVCLAFIVSQVRPVFLDRYLIVVLPALVLATAAGAMRARFRAAGAVLIVITIAFSARELANYYEHSTKTNWRAAAAFILGHSRPGDALVFAPPGLHIPMSLPLAYYIARAPRDEVRPAALYPPGEWTLPGLPPRVAAGELDLPSPPKLRAAEGRYRRIWLIAPKNNHQNTPAPERKSRQTALKSVAGLVPVMTKTFGNLRVELRRQRSSS
jgi:4-amino-4-deoxy-L-arabinose transferase-like glycosyltransferase